MSSRVTFIGLLLVVSCLLACTPEEEEDGPGYGLFETLIVSSEEPTSGLHLQMRFDRDEVRFVGLEPAGDLELAEAAFDDAGDLHVGIIGVDEADGPLLMLVFAGVGEGVSAGAQEIELVEQQRQDGQDFSVEIERTSDALESPLGTYTALGAAKRLRDESPGVDLGAGLELEPGFADDPLGDVMEDGEVNLADAQRALAIAHGVETEGRARQLYHADIDGDGVVTAVDALVILQKAIGADYPGRLIVYPPYTELDEDTSKVVLAQNAGNQSLGDLAVSKSGYEGLSLDVEVMDHGIATVVSGAPPMSGSLRVDAAEGDVGWSFIVDSTELMDLYLEMTPEDLEHLYERDIHSNDRLPATARLSVDGEVLELRGLRYRGNSSRRAPKKSFNIRFEDRQDFLYGSSRMNINAMYTDPSMMRERLALDLFRDMGVPTSRTRYFNLYINGIYEGLYLHIERVDEDLIAHSGLSEDGTLVRDQFRDFLHSDDRIDGSSFFGFDIDSVDDPDEFLHSRTNQRGDPDYGSVADLIRWVYTAEAGSAFADEFADRIDVDIFMSWLAIHYVLADSDSFGDDYWLYLDHEDPDARWKFIPWDKDLSFGSAFRQGAQPGGTQNDFFSYEGAIGDRWNNKLVDLVLNTPELFELLSDKILFVMDEIFTPEFVRTKAAGLTHLIGDSINRDPTPDSFDLHGQNHFGELGRHLQHRELLEDFIRLRRGFLRAELLGGEGAAGEATLDLRSSRPGDRVPFIDAEGWTIGELELHTTPPQDPVTLSVSQESGLHGIDRTWNLDTNNWPLTGRLTLYYRNDVVANLGRENWYPEDLAIGGQWSLKMAQSRGDAFQILSSEVNPYTNRVSADVEMTGNSSFRLVYD